MVFEITEQSCFHYVAEVLLFNQRPLVSSLRLASGCQKVNPGFCWAHATVEFQSIFLIFNFFLDFIFDIQVLFFVCSFCFGEVFLFYSLGLVFNHQYKTNALLCCGHVTDTKYVTLWIIFYIGGTLHIIIKYLIDRHIC